jgi:ribosome-associated protein
MASPREGFLEIGSRRPLPLSELEVRFSRSGGPGGQHVNTSSTRVEVLFDLDGSPTLDADEKRRVRGRLGGRVDSDGMLRVVAQEERSQLRNREIATRRLGELLRQALAPPPPPRRPTRPSRAATAERLAEKRRQAERKRGRQPPPVEE